MAGTQRRLFLGWVTLGGFVLSHRAVPLFCTFLHGNSIAQWGAWQKRRGHEMNESSLPAVGPALGLYPEDSSSWDLF